MRLKVPRKMHDVPSRLHLIHCSHVESVSGVVESRGPREESSVMISFFPLLLLGRSRVKELSMSWRNKQWCNLEHGGHQSRQ